MAIAFSGRHFTIDEFRQYVHKTPLGVYHTVYVHHTASPDTYQWHGLSTLQNIFIIYAARGWGAGPHLFVADDGIWEGTPCNRDGIGVAYHNYQTRHIETVGNYTSRLPFGATLANVVAATGILLQKPAPLSTDRIRQHRWDGQTSCPGNAWSVRWGWFRGLVREYMAAHPLASGLDGSSPSLEMAVRAAAWGAKGLALNRDAAFPSYAREHSLGAPKTPEITITYGATKYRLQGFSFGIVFCRVGAWSQVERVAW